MLKKIQNILQEKQMHWPVLITGFLITCILSRLVYIDTHKQAEVKFNSEVLRIENNLTSKLSEYEQILMGGAGLFKVLGSVSREQWKIYNMSIDIKKNYPSLKGVGFAQRVPHAYLNDFIKEVQDDGVNNNLILFPNYKKDYFITKFLEPFNDENQHMLGFDMSSNPTYKKVMDISRDNLEPSLSYKIKISERGEEGFIMFMPIYKNDVDNNNVDKRRNNLIGYVYEPFNSKIFMNQILKTMNLTIGIKVYENENLNQNILTYETDKNINIYNENFAFVKNKSYINYNKRYTIVYYTLPEFDKEMQNVKWIFVLLVGFLLNLLFFSLIRSLVTTNMKAAKLAREMTKELRENKEKLEKLAHYDSLTGLENRFFFNKNLNHAINLALRHNHKIALLFIDLDGFKYINDNFGHDAGDFVLKQVAKRIKTCLRTVDTVARLGGDEFVILIEKEVSIESLSIIAHNLIKEINLPMKFNEKNLEVGISIGIAICPDDAKDSKDLMKKADHAMYNIKQNGKNSFSMCHNLGE